METTFSVKVPMPVEGKEVVVLFNCEIVKDGKRIKINITAEDYGITTEMYEADVACVYLLDGDIKILEDEVRKHLYGYFMHTWREKVPQKRILENWTVESKNRDGSEPELKLTYVSSSGAKNKELDLTIKLRDFRVSEETETKLNTELSKIAPKVNPKLTELYSFGIYGKPILYGQNTVYLRTLVGGLPKNASQLHFNVSVELDMLGLIKEIGEFLETKTRIDMYCIGNEISKTVVSKYIDKNMDEYIEKSLGVLKRKYEEFHLEKDGCVVLKDNIYAMTHVVINNRPYSIQIKPNYTGIIDWLTVTNNWKYTMCVYQGSLGSFELTEHVGVVYQTMLHPETLLKYLRVVNEKDTLKVYISNEGLYEAYMAIIKNQFHEPIESVVIDQFSTVSRCKYSDCVKMSESRFLKQLNIVDSVTQQDMLETVSKYTTLLVLDNLNKKVTIKYRIKTGAEVIHKLEGDDLIKVTYEYIMDNLDTMVTL